MRTQNDPVSELGNKIIAIPARTKSIKSLSSAAISTSLATVISIEQGSRVRTSEIVSNWKELHCNLTLSQIAIFTNLVRAVTVRLKLVDRRNEYQDVLEKIDCRLNGILARYPGSEFDFETDPRKDVFRACNIGRVPVTDEGFDFIKSVYDLLEGRRDELEAQEKRLEDERNALLLEKANGTPPAKGLWDVTYALPMFGIRTTIRMRANNEDHAIDLGCDFFNGENGQTLSSKPANKQHRKIYEMTDSASWKWRSRRKAKKYTPQEISDGSCTEIGASKGERDVNKAKPSANSLCGLPLPPWPNPAPQPKTPDPDPKRED
jgi:hypothetical protein